MVNLPKCGACVSVAENKGTLIPLHATGCHGNIQERKRQAISGYFLLPQH